MLFAQRHKTGSVTAKDIGVISRCPTQRRHGRDDISEASSAAAICNGSGVRRAAEKRLCMRRIMKSSLSTTTAAKCCSAAEQCINVSMHGNVENASVNPLNCPHN